MKGALWCGSCDGPRLQAPRPPVLAPACVASCLLVSQGDSEAGLGQVVVVMERPLLSRSLVTSDSIDLVASESECELEGA